MAKFLILSFIFLFLGVVFFIFAKKQIKKDRDSISSLDSKEEIYQKGTKQIVWNSLMSLGSTFLAISLICLFIAFKLS